MMNASVPLLEINKGIVMVSRYRHYIHLKAEQIRLSVGRSIVQTCAYGHRPQIAAFMIQGVSSN
jgi:hypothetical protein